MGYLPDELIESTSIATTDEIKGGLLDRRHISSDDYSDKIVRALHPFTFDDPVKAILFAEHRGFVICEGCKRNHGLGESTKQ